MTRLPFPPLEAPAAAPAPGHSTRALVPTHDCEICIVGDDVPALLMARDLAAHGRAVVLVPAPEEEPDLGLDGALAPGFRLPACALRDQLGRVDAAELLTLSHAAAARGLALAQDLGVGLGPKGRLAVARAHASDLLAAEHEAFEEMLPGASLLLGEADVNALLAPDGLSLPFVAGLGLVPAQRVDAAALRRALARAAQAAGATLMPRSAAPEVDAQGLRKYVTTPEVKVRAFALVLSGAAALRGLAPRLAPSLVREAWVTGRFQLKEAPVPYAGLVEEAGRTGLRWCWDDGHLALGAQTATPVRGRGAIAAVLRRHGRAVAAGLNEAWPEHPQGRMRTGLRRRMPLLAEAEKGVFYCVTEGVEELTHGILGATLITAALLERDGRLHLFKSFGLEPPQARPVPRYQTFISYWRNQLAALSRPATPARGAGTPRE